MKKLFYLFLFTPFLFGYSQADSIQHPDIWLRCDYWTDSVYFWNDVSGNHHHAMTIGSKPDTMWFNFNTSFVLNEDSYFSIPNYSISQKFTTTFIVYQTLDSSLEQGLWSFQYLKGNAGLTTMRILSESGDIVYTDKNNTHAIINSLSEPNENFPTDSVTVNIGICDSLHFNGKIAEFLLFNQMLDQEDLTKWLSYLAVKYGITLQQTDYRNSSDGIIWNYEEYSKYSSFISGIGRDSVMNLHQKRTCFIHENNIIGTDEDLGNDDFLLFGSDETMIETPQFMNFVLGDSTLYYGNCMAQIQGATARSIPTFLRIDVSHWQGNIAEYQLIIDRSGNGDFLVSNVASYSPSKIDTIHQLIEFSNILWDIDGNGVDYFRFLYIGSQRDRQQDCSLPNHEDSTLYFSMHAASNNVSSTMENSYLLYPNPNSGEFSLKINLKEISNVQVQISTIHGQIINATTGEGLKNYLFHYSFPQQGIFLINIDSDKDRKTLKMIVQ